MTLICKKIIPVVLAMLLLQSCFFYAAYGILRTINDINYILRTINTSMTTIQTVMKEGKDLKRAAKDGQLVATMAEKIPGLIRKQVDKAVNEKINLLSGDLRTSALNFTKHAIKENLKEAHQSYNQMVDTYNRFTDLMTDLSQAASPVNPSGS
jgi:hypothetical protein